MPYSDKTFSLLSHSGGIINDETTIDSQKFDKARNTF